MSELNEATKMMLEIFKQFYQPPSLEDIADFKEGASTWYGTAAQKEKAEPIETALVGAALRDVDWDAFTEEIASYEEEYKLQAEHPIYEIPSLHKMDEPTHEIYILFGCQIYPRLIDIMNFVGFDEAVKQTAEYIEDQYEYYIERLDENDPEASWHMSEESAGGNYENAAAHLICQALFEFNLIDKPDDLAY